MIRVLTIFLLLERHLGEFPGGETTVTVLLLRARQPKWSRGEEEKATFKVVTSLSSWRSRNGHSQGHELNCAMCACPSRRTAPACALLVPDTYAGFSFCPTQHQILELLKSIVPNNLNFRA